MEAEHAGASMQMLDRLSVNLLKAWWRCEAFLERWTRTMAQETEAHDPYLPPDMPRPGRGPCQVIVYGDSASRTNWKLLVALAVGAVVGFIGGMTWSHSKQIDVLERFLDAQDKLSGRSTINP